MTDTSSTAAHQRGSNVEKRRARRRAVGIRAGLRNRGTTAFEVDVTDLSTTGFRTETSFTLWPGHTVWVQLPGFAKLEAVVAWRDKYRYGCAFRVPLHQAVLDHIVARNWAARPAGPAGPAGLPAN